METTDTNALDQADMARLAGGQDAALDDLMDRHAAKVFRFLCRLLGSADDANDLAQETFVRVFQHRSSFKPEAKFTTWLYTIAGNLARNHHRWRSRHPTVSLDAPAQDTEQSLGNALPTSEASPQEATVAAERAEAVRAAVQALPDEMRQAIILCEWEDMTVSDAAVVLESTPKAVESRLYRARQLLREKLRRWL